MKLTKFIGAALLIGSMAASTTFAAADVPVSLEMNDLEQKNIITGLEVDDSKDHDPIKFLEKKKAKIQSLLKEGKIEKERADSAIKKIDERIKDMKEFNKLTVKQKKEKLIRDFEARIAEKVKTGKLTKEKGDEILEKFTEKIEKWDGKGYPDLHKKNHHKGKCHKNKK